MKYRLTMRSGVAHDNDNEIGDFLCERTAFLVGDLLWALDRNNCPEYRGFDVDKIGVEEVTGVGDG